jgi:hypothetical protein
MTALGWTLMVISTKIMHLLKFYQGSLLSQCLSRNFVVESIDQIPNSLYMLVQYSCKLEVIIFPHCLYVVQETVEHFHSPALTASDLPLPDLSLFPVHSLCLNIVMSILLA